MIFKEPELRVPKLGGKRGIRGSSKQSKESQEWEEKHIKTLRRSKKSNLLIQLCRLGLVVESKP